MYSLNFNEYCVKFGLVVDLKAVTKMYNNSCRNEHQRYKYHKETKSTKYLHTKGHRR